MVVVIIKGFFAVAFRLCWQIGFIFFKGVFRLGLFLVLSQQSHAVTFLMQRQIGFILPYNRLIILGLCV